MGCYYAECSSKHILQNTMELIVIKTVFDDSSNNLWLILTTVIRKQPVTLSSLSLCTGNNPFPLISWQRCSHYDPMVCINSLQSRSEKCWPEEHSLLLCPYCLSSLLSIWATINILVTCYYCNFYLELRKEKQRMTIVRLIDYTYFFLHDFFWQALPSCCSEIRYQSVKPHCRAGDAQNMQGKRSIT